MRYCRPVKRVSWPRIFITTSRSSAPSNLLCGMDSIKSMVLAMRDFSSGMVCSVSSCLGISTPASRATAPLAVSQEICTCRASGNMSAIRRSVPTTVGSSFRRSACALALSRIFDRLRRVLAKRGALAWYMEIFMALFYVRGQAPFLQHDRSLNLSGGLYAQLGDYVSDPCHRGRGIRLRRHRRRRRRHREGIVLPLPDRLRRLAGHELPRPRRPAGCLGNQPTEKAGDDPAFFLAYS